MPDAFYKQAVAMAEREKVPVERLLSLALAQALGAWQTESVIAERTRRGNRERFLAVLARAPHTPPLAGDELPASGAPCAVHGLAVAMAERERVLVERLLSLALAQAMGAWQTESVIAERARRGSRARFLAVLVEAPDAAPVVGDRLPAS